MRKIFTKWTSLTIVLSMLFSMLPAFTAFAATRIEITSLYTNSADPRTVNEVSQVTRFTINPMTITVTVEGIPDDELDDLFYEISNPDTGEVITETANKAQETDNAFEVQFQNVNLTEGLNKITIKMGGSTTVSSVPGWAYFTPITNILDLKVNDEIFVNDPLRLYPGGSPYTSVDFNGSAPNATSIEAYVLGNSEAVEGFLNNDNEFSFIANTPSGGGDITLNPGDNEITFVARNGANKYQTKRNFVYDNGTAFPYNVELRNGGSADPYSYLKNTPRITTSSVEVQAYLKNNINSVTSDVYYRYMDVFINSSADPDFPAFDFADPAVTQVTESSADYDVFEYNGTHDFNTSTKYQQIDFVFYNSSSPTPTNGTSSGLSASNKLTVSYNFIYEDASGAYIDHVTKVVGDDIEVQLNETSTNEISELPTDIKVYTNDNTESIAVKIDGVDYTCSTCATYVDTGSIREFTVTLEGIADGFTELEIIPSITADSTGETLSGKLTYDLMIIASPYVIPTNIYEGQIIESAADLSCISGTPCITGRFVNLPASEFPNVEIYVNNKLFQFDGDPALPTADGIFTLFSNTPVTGLLDSDFQEGRNVIKFFLYLNGELVSESTVNVFKFSEDVPSITRIIPLETDTRSPKFIQAQTADKYVTEEESVQLVGEIANLGNNPIFGFTVRNKDGVTTPTITVGPTFTTPVVALPVGETTFEFEVTNDSNVNVTKTITITRENLPYVINSPVLFENAKGVDQANINSNFSTIVMTAEGADRVVIGKEDAIYNSTDNTFVYEATNLKNGENKINFTVIRGEEETKGTFILFNLNTPIEGAQYKTKLQSKMKVFDGDVELEFPKQTYLMRNERDAGNQYVSSDRQILFGIANNDEGSIRKDESVGSGDNYLEDPTGRFKPAGKLIWIDAGTISEDADQDASDYENALKGGGTPPYPISADGETFDRFFERDFEDLVIPTKPGTLTLKYDANIRDNAWKYLTVYHFDIFEDANGSIGPGWKNIGGVVDSKSNTITVPLERFGFYQVMYMDDSFDDITSHDYARDELDNLYATGVMKPKTSSRFVPNDPISRGEFATMLVKVFEIPLANEDTFKGDSDSDEGTFRDVLRGRDYRLYDFLHIEAAARAGIVRGQVGGYFRPGDSITRQDAAMMIARAAELKINSDTAKVTQSLQKLFTDANLIDDYSKPSVEAITKDGLIEGIENVLLDGQTKASYRFDPLEPMTRAQAAVIMNRVLKQEGKIPKK